MLKNIFLWAITYVILYWVFDWLLSLPRSSQVIALAAFFTLRGMIDEAREKEATRNPTRPR